MRFDFSLLILVLAVASARADVVNGIKASDSMPRCVEPDPDAGHRFKPGCTETITRSGATSEMSYNSLGLRDKEYSSKPRRGWKRVLLVGASRMVGPGLAEINVPPRKLETFLRQNKLKVEIINASVEGYEPVQQAVKLGEWIKAYNPTHVLVHLSTSGALGSDSLYAPYLIQTADSLRVEMRVFPWMRPYQWLSSSEGGEFAKLRRVYSWQSGLYRACLGLKCKYVSKSRLERTGCFAGVTLSALTRMRDITEKSGAKYFVVFNSGMSPNKLIVSPAFDFGILSKMDDFTPFPRLVDNSEILTLLHRQKISGVLLAPIQGDGFTLPGDYHYNEAGSAMFARNLSIRMQALLELQ